MSGVVLRAGEAWHGHAPPRRGASWSAGVSVCAHLGVGLLALAAHAPSRQPPPAGDVLSFEVAFLPGAAHPAEVESLADAPAPPEAESPLQALMAEPEPIPPAEATPMATLPMLSAESVAEVAPPAAALEVPVEPAPMPQALTLSPQSLAASASPEAAADGTPEPAPMPKPPMVAPAPTPEAPRPVARAPRPEQRRTASAEPRQASRGAGPASAASPAASPAQAHAAPAADPGPPLITTPRFRHPPRPPEYPPRAIELDITGTVVIRALLDPAGDPQEARIHRSSGHSILDGAALAAVRRWAFEPAARDGRRIEAWVEVPVHFRLN